MFQIIQFFKKYILTMSQTISILFLNNNSFKVLTLVKVVQST